MFKGYKFPLYPTEEQRQSLERDFGAARFVYNHFLNMRKDFYESGEPINHSYVEKTLPFLKEIYPFLKETNSQILTDSTKNLDKAFQKFFTRSGKYPVHKSKKYRQSIKIPQRFKLNSSSVDIPGIIGIKMKRTREIPESATIKSLTIVKTARGKYSVDVLVDDHLEPPVKPTPKKNSAIGIDLGIKHYATFSTGDKIDNPKWLQASLKQLQRRSRALSKKKKGSRNRYKAQLRLSALHERIHCQRIDFIHKTTSQIAYDSQGVTTICVENLSVSGMIKNRRLSTSISDASWGTFLRQLKYKTEWAGKNLLQCGQFDATSKTCSCCGHKKDELKLSTRKWTCKKCLTRHDRDVNAAKCIVKFAFKRYVPAG